VVDDVAEEFGGFFGIVAGAVAAAFPNSMSTSQQAFDSMI